METSEDCNDIINHVSEVSGHLRMDRLVGVVPDFLDESFDGAGCLLDSDPSPVLGRVDSEGQAGLLTKGNLNCLSLPQWLQTFLWLSLAWVVLGLLQ